jgi:uncharacterized membrane protein (UPF0127 family)
MNEVTVLNRTRATTVGTRIAIADTSITRLVGLMGRRGLDAGSGLFIKPSSGVHTFGMLISIDVVALDRHLRVLKLWPKMGPFRLTSISFKTHSVLELPAGRISECQIEVGDQLEIT